jgi:hypothetical protein
MVQPKQNAVERIQQIWARPRGASGASAATVAPVEGMDPYFYDQCSVTGEDCRNTYATLTETMDWIGTTEGLSTETIPLLQHILFADKKDERMVKKQKVHDKSSFKESLQESTMQKLRSKTTHDQWIYDEVKARYTSHWLNLEL